MSDQTLKIPLVWSPSFLHCQVPVQFSLSVFVFPHGNVGSVWPGSRSEVLSPSLSLPPLVFKVGSYGGKLKYTISYVAGSRGTLLEDADIQIIVSTLSLIDVCLSWWPVFYSHYCRWSIQGNDITLVNRQPWQRRHQGSRETQKFEIVFREVRRSRQLSQDLLKTRKQNYIKKKKSDIVV